MIDQLYNPEGRLRKKVSVERAYNEVKAERLIDAELDSSGNSNDASGEAVDGETNDSDMGKCMQRASKERVVCYTKKAIYLCDSGVLFNKKTQNIIDQHEMSICAWNGRIEFVPGDLLIIVLSPTPHTPRPTPHT
ncbi:hypothetical protein [Moorena sp. SIO4G3]|uniref:hypothetical protein n=1 Tax=Moorena sp. SIO4G3 TaxID=2607821 RepID=UPI00142928BE|nr:hypothetical protein [Moorena sp. SIO4G3]NEO75520.1 hypothetical protein [Moorena sp. SIO4G3]